jgi:hypothetical protein
MWQPVYVRSTTLQVSVATTSLLRKRLPLRPQTSFRGLHDSKDWTDGSRKEPDPGCKMDEAGQSTEDLWWTLGYANLCVASHCRGEEALLSHLYGDEHSGNEFPGRDSPVVSNMTRCSVAGVTAVDGRPERGRSDTLLCPYSNDANRFALRPTVLLSTAMSPYTFIKRLWMFVIDSFSEKRNSITALCLERTSLTDSILKVHYFATM